MKLIKRKETCPPLRDFLPLPWTNTPTITFERNNCMTDIRKGKNWVAQNWKKHHIWHMQLWLETIYVPHHSPKMNRKKDMYTMAMRGVVHSTRVIIPNSHSAAFKPNVVDSNILWGEWFHINSVITDRIKIL